MKVNPGLVPTKIQIGDTIKIPIDIVNIQSGNTIDGLGATRNPKVTATQVVVVNDSNLKPNNLSIGQKVNFPRKP